MVGSDFIDIVSKFKVTTYVGLEDFVDRLNFLFTSVLLMVCCSVVTVKTYFMSPLSCYVSTPVSGTGNMDYVSSWCWIEGTYAVDVHEMHKLTKNNAAMEQYKIYYYQWVPFVLGLQLIMFYLPRIIWQFFSHNCSGTDLEYVITIANEAVHADQEKRRKLLDHINKTLVNILYQHREYRTSGITVVKRYLHRFCTIFMPSKRLGTKLVNFYLLIKILYAANSIGQLFLMHRFLRMKGDYPIFGYYVMKDLWNGVDWRNTYIFPRYGACTMWLKVAASNHYQFAQCTLPINMLNEKIYIFLWLWIAVVSVLNVLSIFRWIFRIVMVNMQYRFLKKFLRLNGQYSKDSADKDSLKRAIRHFSKAFLRRDGVFLLRMISINTGDVLCSEIVHKLWETFKRKYAQRDFRDDTDFEKNLPPPPPPMPLSARTPSPESNQGGSKSDFKDEGKTPLLTPTEKTMKQLQSRQKGRAPAGRQQQQHPMPKHPTDQELLQVNELSRNTYQKPGNHAA